jgi:hypothetical protein
MALAVIRERGRDLVFDRLAYSCAMPSSMPDLETLADQSDKVENVPGIFFAPHGPNSCCLCGSTENLTGEHKVKRTALSQEFGSATMAIGVAGDEKSKLRYAQSPKSKAFHFEAKLCARRMLSNLDR